MKRKYLYINSKQLFENRYQLIPNLVRVTNDVYIGLGPNRIDLTITPNIEAARFINIYAFDSNGTEIYSVKRDSKVSDLELVLYMTDDIPDGMVTILISLESPTGIIGYSTTELIFDKTVLSKTTPFYSGSIPAVLLDSNTPSSYSYVTYVSGSRFDATPYFGLSYLYRNGTPKLFKAGQQFESDSISGVFNTAPNQITSDVSSSATYSISIPISNIGTNDVTLSSPIIINGIPIASGLIAGSNIEYEYAISSSISTNNVFNTIVLECADIQPSEGVVTDIFVYSKSVGTVDYKLISNIKVPNVLSDVVDTNIIEYSYSDPDLLAASDNIKFKVQLPSYQIDDVCDILITYSNIDGRYSTTRNELKSISLQGGNTYIQGLNNQITGSIYIGHVTGSGLELYGGISSSYIRSAGFEGIENAISGSPSGMLLYVGDVRDNIPASSSYSGVGIEIFNHTGSYFKFGTDSCSEIAVCELILTSPNGTRYKIQVDDAGTISTGIKTG